MWSLVFVSLASLLAATASAAFEGNLNYNSPSRRHDRLGIDISLVTRRSWKRGNVAYDPSELAFTHGVASGDPWADSVILWTRIAPSNESDESNVTVEGTVPLYDHETERYIKADANPICLEWKVFKSKCANSTNNIVSQGKAYTTSDIDYTVKVLQTKVQNAHPLADYCFRWKPLVFNPSPSTTINSMSAARTRKVPLEGPRLHQGQMTMFRRSVWLYFPAVTFVSSRVISTPSAMRYSQFLPAYGYFNAYGNAARKDKHDYVIHLGDYLYETARAGERAHAPNHTIFTLHDYRTRHNQVTSLEGRTPMKSK